MSTLAVSLTDSSEMGAPKEHDHRGQCPICIVDTISLICDLWQLAGFFLSLDICFKCCVPGCLSSPLDAILHKLPKCEKRLKKWLESINCDSLRNLSANELGKLQVCHKHFEARFVTQKSRLLRVAYPTLLLQSKVLSGIPLNRSKNNESLESNVDYQYAKQMHYDHNYCLVQQVQLLHTQKLLPTTDAIPSTSKDVNQTCNVQQQALPTSDIILLMSSREYLKNNNILENKVLALDSTLKRNNVKHGTKHVPKVEILTPKCKK